MRTSLHFSATFYPQIDSQPERVIQTLEDMFRACVLDFKSNWEAHLLFIEFSYNNSFQTSIRIAPFKALYSQKCRLPICWTKIGEKKMLEQEFVQLTTDVIKLVKKHYRRPKPEIKAMSMYRDDLGNSRWDIICF